MLWGPQVWLKQKPYADYAYQYSFKAVSYTHLSFCPPEAAFIAADRVGFYLQPEGPSWPNHGPKLGLGQPIDTYLKMCIRDSFQSVIENTNTPAVGITGSPINTLAPEGLSLIHI